jgi:hypothetical protein
VAILFGREAALNAGPPRALFVPFRHGFPDDPPNQPGRLLNILGQALNLFEIADRGQHTWATYREPGRDAVSGLT